MLGLVLCTSMELEQTEDVNTCLYGGHIINVDSTSQDLSRICANKCKVFC